MNKKTIKFGFMCLITLLLMPIHASAYDMIMPSFDFLEAMLTWHIILIGLAVEIVFVKCFLKETLLKSVLIAFLMNVVSTVLGIVAIPLSGLIGELLLFMFPTYHISHWILSFLFAAVLNATFEALTAKLIFKYKFKELFSWLCLTNAIFFIVCFFFNPYLMEHVHF